MQAGNEFDPADDYEAAAQLVARRFGCAIHPDAVRALLVVPQHVIDDIEANPHEWSRRVSDYCYAIAMGNSTAA